mgnify:CR=1 FL=1
MATCREAGASAPRGSRLPFVPHLVRSKERHPCYFYCYNAFLCQHLWQQASADVEGFLTAGELKAGELLGNKYEVQEVLGRGANAVTYKVCCGFVGRCCAVVHRLGAVLLFAVMVL